MPGFSMPIHKTARKELLREGFAQVLDAAHDNEHGIETQLPFLHAVHPKARLIPLVVGNAPVAEIACVVDYLAGDDTLFVISSDLSHFLDLDSARCRDWETAAMIETSGLQRLSTGHACGARPIAGYLASRTGGGARALRLGLASSFDHTGDASRVVGYGAWTLHGEEDQILDDDLRAELTSAARQALQGRLVTGKVPRVNMQSYSCRLHTVASSFVTLKRNGRLRGCIGTLGAVNPLVRDVVENAVKAGFADARFPALRQAELSDLEVHVSVLSRPKPLAASSEEEALSLLVPGKSGLILREGNKRGVFLPQVWETLTEPNGFLKGLRRKAGLSEDYWSDDLQLYRFFSESFCDESPQAQRSAA